jgi:4-hydroxy-tetrahydrodipicolinate reductase
MIIALIGYGTMGREVETAAREREITVGPIFSEEENPGGAALTRESLRGVDVCIDFTSAASVPGNVRAAAAAGCNIVVGTTGWYDRLTEIRSIVEAKGIGFLYASNFSLGVNLFFRIASDAARLIGRYPGYDVAIQETHHRRKADSPSGTALTLGSLVLQAFPAKSEILPETSHGAPAPERLHVTSTRVGSVPGMHTVLFDSEADTIELKHTARSRRGFALGALIAAEWLKGKHGFFTMQDVIRP